MKLKSAVAIGAGILFVIIVTTAVDVVLHAVGAYAAWGQPLSQAESVMALSYRLVCGVAGAWITARLAPREPLHHTVILGFIGTGLAFLGLIVTWNLDLGPRWYPISLAVTALPTNWLGGWIYVSKRTPIYLRTR